LLMHSTITSQPSFNSGRDSRRPLLTLLTIGPPLLQSEIIYDAAGCHDKHHKQQNEDHDLTCSTSPAVNK
jgi:hypothetical protein